MGGNELKSKTRSFFTVKRKTDDNDPYRIAERQKKRDEQKVTLIRLTYDKYNDYYKWDEWRQMKRCDVPEDAVHVTGKRNTYLWTDLWDELTWAKGGQSAIHMYLWMINEKMDPDRITEKKKAADIDWKKVLMIAGAVILIIILVPRFM